MNLTNIVEEETKTIKYLNKNSGSEKDQRSDSNTEKQSERDRLAARGIFYSKQNEKHQTDRQRPNCKIVVAQTLQNFPAPKDSVIIYPSFQKNRHKKGKSVDLEEMITGQKQKKGFMHNEGPKERYRPTMSKQMNIDYRQRNSISEMKQYNYGSKKLNGIKKTPLENSCNIKKKKAKTINQGDVKSIKKQIRRLLQETPLYIKPKRKNSAKFAPKAVKINVNNPKNDKKYSKSLEIFTDGKMKSTHRERNEARKFDELKQVSFTMPITSKIISLFSNPSSVYNSQKELEIYNKGKCFIIPTEESVDEIGQMRQYENLVLKKRNSDSLRQLRKPPINQITQELSSTRESTENIINYYLQKFKENQFFQQNLTNNIEDLSYIPDINKQNPQEGFSDVMQGSFNLAEIHSITQSQNVRLENSQVINVINQHFIGQQEHEQELNQLNHVIHQIQRSGGKLNQQQKKDILFQIKGLIQKSSRQLKNEGEKIQEKQRIQQRVQKQKIDLNNSDLKQSISSQENISLINLRMLDKALRQRETYLIERKQKELQKIQENCERKREEHIQEKEKIVKWIDHQLKEVVHTRHQLWKGFNLAKNILQGKEEPSIKKKEMMKCLSDKYLGPKLKKNTNKIKKNEKEKVYKVQSQQSVDDSSSGLGEGRINESNSIEVKKPQIVQAQMDISSHSEESFGSDELLIQSNKQKSQKKFETFKLQKFEEQQVVEEIQSKNINLLNEAIKMASPGLQKVRQTQGGLNLMQIECDIQYEDSYNEEELQALTKESQVIKNDSIKMPVLSVEDKEDIYEFIFLDLCIELTDEYGSESNIMKKIYSFIRSVREQSKKQKGFKTNTNSIKDYLYEFISFLKNKSQLLGEVHQNIDKPLGPTAIDILKYMHVQEEDPIEEESNETVFILDLRTFQQFENVYLPKIQFQKYYEDEQKQKKRRAFLKNAIHIHNKAIFDALNETLDKERPFGVWGEPFQWKNIAKFYHIRDASAKNNIILKSAQKTIQFGAYMCGFMVDKQECNLKGNPNISQAYIEQIRDDRLSRMLANDLQESEQKMLFIDDEQTQILVEISHMISQILFQEVIKELINLL